MSRFPSLAVTRTRGRPRARARAGWAGWATWATFALAALALVSLVMGGVVGVAACGSGSGSASLPPITGIVVRAETLTTGRGCGTSSTQVFKYAAVVFGLNPADMGKPPGEQHRSELLAANVYDCFSDGLFVDLPASGGSSDYDLQIYVYNQAAYTSAGGDPILTGITTRLQFNRANLQNDGGPADRAAIELDLTRLRATQPTFTTTCRAQQFELVQSNATCKSFSPGTGAVGGDAAATTPATITFSAGSFASADGGTLKCDSDYVTVRYRASTATVIGDVTEVRCSALTSTGSEVVTVTVPAPAAPASYTIDVALLRGDGSAVGLASCGAETSPGATSPAVCTPIR